MEKIDGTKEDTEGAYTVRTVVEVTYNEVGEAISMEIVVVQDPHDPFGMVVTPPIPWMLEAVSRVAAHTERACKTQEAEQVTVDSVTPVLHVVE